MITDEQMESALDWIRNNATRAAISRSNKESLEEYTAILEAELMEEIEGPEHAKKAYARSHEKFRTHWIAVNLVREEAYKFQYLMKAAENRINAWQTQSANNRRGNI